MRLLAAGVELFHCGEASNGPASVVRWGACWVECLGACGECTLSFTGRWALLASAAGSSLQPTLSQAGQLQGEEGGRRAGCQR